MCNLLTQTRETAQIYGPQIQIAPPTSAIHNINSCTIHNQCTCQITRDVAVAVPYVRMACATSSDIIVRTES